MSAGARGIILFGATGYTGRLIARRLDALRVPFTLAARDASRARSLQAELRTRPPVALVDVTDPLQVGRAVAEAEIVINCVGPYNLYGQVVWEACRMRDLVYLDLCGEQEFIRKSFAVPQRAGWSATLLHSIAFESALADLLAHGMLDRDTSYRSISSYYSFAKSRPSPGTHLTMRLAAHYPTYHLQSGSLRRAEALSFEESVEFYAPEGMTTAFFMPYPEVLFFADRYRTSDARSYLLMGSSEALFARAARGRSAPPVDAILEQHQRQRREGPPEAERQKQRFTLTVHAAEAGGQRHTRTIAGCDMYAISAVLVLHVVEALLAGTELPKGPLAPSQAPVWDGIWARLAEEGLVLSPAGVA